MQFNEAEHQEAWELDAILLEEDRNKALANVHMYKEFLWRHYNKAWSLKHSW
jgi:hypothetical protein